MDSYLQKAARIGPATLLLAVAASVVLLSGCCTSPRQWLAQGMKVGPDYCDPGAPVAEDWIDADDRRVIDSPADHAAWWARLNDPVLNELVAAAYRQNLTLQEAGARITEARSLRAIAVGNFFPQRQDVTARYSHNLTPGVAFDRHFSLWDGAFNLAWELDFWGRYRRAIEAADADLQASVYDYGDVVVTLIADVAATYIEIRTLQTRLELVRRNVEIQLKTYELTQTRFQAGETSAIDVEQARSSLAQTKAFVPQLETALRQAQNGLCILLGIPPRLLVEQLGKGPIPAVAPEIAVDIPATTLMRRPDVRRAERQLAAQAALIGVAESDLYPQITLSADVGRAGSQFDDLFRSGSSFGSIGPSLRWNVLNYCRIIESIRVQDARFRQMLARYRQTVLLANLEAENAIVEFLNAQDQLSLQVEAAEAAGATNDLILLQLEEGVVDFNRVFNVQNFKTQQEVAAAVARGEVAQNLVAIYRAIGGGWPSPFLGAPIIELPPPQQNGAEDIPPIEAMPVPADELDNPAAAS